MKNLFNYFMLALMACAILAGLASCSDSVTKEKELEDKSLYSNLLARVKILENSTITHVSLTSEQRLTLLVGDTVWVNLDLHTVDDLSEHTMLGVLQPKAY